MVSYDSCCSVIGQCCPFGLVFPLVVGGAFFQLPEFFPIMTIRCDTSIADQNKIDLRILIEKTQEQDGWILVRPGHYLNRKNERILGILGFQQDLGSVTFRVQRGSKWATISLVKIHARMIKILPVAVICIFSSVTTPFVHMAIPGLVPRFPTVFLVGCLLIFALPESPGSHR